MEPAPHLLMVEDDRDISDLVRRFLERHGFRVALAADGREADRLMAAQRFALVILDVMLPGEDGLSLCRRLRAGSNVPILMLTALGEETDRIIGLEMGADDYLAKPFNPRELLARVRAILRRASAAQSAPAAASRVLRFAGWQLDTVARELRAPDQVLVPLTTGEYELLLALCRNAGRVLTREQLLDLTHGRAAPAFDRSVDIQVSRLRRKIEADAKLPLLIKTVRSGGYLFTADVEASD